MMEKITAGDDLYAELRPLLDDLRPEQGPLFRDFCVCLARLEQIERQIEADGLLIPGHRGITRKHPLLQIAREHRQAAQRYMRLFALDRARTKPEDEQQEPEPAPVLDGDWTPPPNPGGKVH